MIIDGASLSMMALRAGPYSTVLRTGLALFSGVVIPLYYLASQNDRMRYDALWDSC